MKQLIGLLAPAAAAGLLAWLLTPVSVWLAWRVGAIDHPGPRRVHARPIPRLGGLAVVVSTVLVLGAVGALGAPRWAAPSVSFGILAGLAPILVVSIRDDISPVRALPKFTAHAIGAGVAMLSGVLLPPTVHLFGVPVFLGWIAIPLSALWLVGLTNAFNFVDGLDGLSAGLGLISAASLAGVLLMSLEPRNAAAALVLGGSIVGFLPYNIHPARVFLGDSGATAIGYLLGCFTLTGSALLSSGFATLIPVVLVGVPVADTLVSIARRTIARLEHGSGNQIYEADGNHIHHRLLALGLSHQRAVVFLCGVGGLLSATALVSLLLTRQQSGFLLLGILLAGFVGLKRLGYVEFALIRRGVALRLYDLPVLRRSFFAVFVDLAVITVALYLSIGLKYDDWNLDRTLRLFLSSLAVLTPSCVIAFTLFGMYRASWRLAGIDAFRRLALAVICGSIVGLVFLAVTRPGDVSMSVFAVYAFVSLVLATGTRVSYRLVDQVRMQAVNRGERTLIYGAGAGGASAVREILSNIEVGLSPVGFIDDNPHRVGKTVNGYPILGNVDEVEAALAKCGATVVVISSPKIPEPKVAEVLRVCRIHGVRLLRMRIGFDEVSNVRTETMPPDSAAAIALQLPEEAAAGQE